MAMTATKTAMTFEEYAALPDGGVRTEFVDGEVIELASANLEHNDLKDGLTERLRPFLRTNPLGVVVSECEFKTIPGRTRRADISFFRSGRILREYARKAVLPVAPDLAIEIASPNDTLAELREKIKEYLQAGVETVWVLYPLTQEAEVCTRDYRQYGVSTLTAACLPGFEISVAQLFSSLQVDPL